MGVGVGVNGCLVGGAKGSRRGEWAWVSYASYRDQNTRRAASYHNKCQLGAIS